MTTITTKTASNVPPGRLVRTRWTRSSPPKPRKTSEKTDAPMKIRNTMLVTTVVVRVTVLSCSRLSWWWAAASRIAPMAPTDAASVGVARPPMIEPSTATMSNSGGISTSPVRRRRPAALKLARSLAGTGGAARGRSSARTIRYAT